MLIFNFIYVGEGGPISSYHGGNQEFDMTGGGGGAFGHSNSFL